MTNQIEWIDNAYGRFKITKSRFGLYTSELEDGTRMVTGATQDAVRFVTEYIHIPVLQGNFTGTTSQGRSAVVEGKL